MSIARYRDKPQDADTVLVSPRYLAGDSCGDTWGAWTAPLRERGWTMLDDGADTTVLISPCLRVRCGWLPETSDYDIQFAASTHPLQALRWHISLQSWAPTEFLTAVATAIADTLAREPQALFPAASWTLLTLPAAPGWRPGSTGEVLSPDGRAYYTRTTGTMFPVDAEGGTAWEFGTITSHNPWRARFSPATPAALIRQFHADFTDPAPLPRAPELLEPDLLDEVLVTRPEPRTTPGAAVSGSAPPRNPAGHIRQAARYQPRTPWGRRHTGR